MNRMNISFSFSSSFQIISIYVDLKNFCLGKSIQNEESQEENQQISFKKQRYEIFDASDQKIYFKTRNSKNQNRTAKQYPSLTGQRKLKCRALGYSFNHSKHYCHVCRNSDSQHLARVCPRWQKYYYGTTQQIAQKIQQSKLNSRAIDRLEPGIYFTTNKQVATEIAKRRETQQRQKGINFKAVVLLAMIIKRQGGYIQRFNCSWKGGFQKSFKQITITNDHLLKIINYEYV